MSKFKNLKQWANHLPNHLRGPYLKYLRRSARYDFTGGLAEALDAAFHWEMTTEGHAFWREVYNVALLRELGNKVKFPPLPVILILLFATLCPAQDTIQLTVTEQGVTYTKFRLTDRTLSATFPGETHLVEIGQTARKYTDEIGVIPGKQVWGFDSTFYYRIITLEYDVAIEVNLPKVGITLQYGNPSLLYLMPEPPPITAFKQTWAIRRANEAREILLKEFSKRFNCSQGYAEPSRMPTDFCKL